MSTKTNVKPTTKEVKTNAAKTAKPVKAKAIGLLLTTEAINTAISSIEKRGKALESDIHVCAVSIIAHTEKHGDITLANRLINAIPNLARKNALRDWFQAFGKFSYSQDAKEMTYDKRKSTNETEAAAMPFWEFKAEAEYKGLDLEQAILSLIERAEKRIVNKDKRDKISPVKLTQLKMLVKGTDTAKAA